MARAEVMEHFMRHSNVVMGGDVGDEILMKLVKAIEPPKI